MEININSLERNHVNIWGNFSEVKFKIKQIALLCFLITSSQVQSSSPPEGLYKFVISLTTKYMDIKGGNTTNGTKVHLWEKEDELAQLFELEDAGDGYFYIRSLVGENIYLHVEGNSNRQGAALVIWEGRGNNNTKWRFIETKGGYQIQSRLGKYLNFTFGLRNGAHLFLNRNGGSVWNLVIIEKKEEVNKRIQVSLSDISLVGNHNKDCRRLQGAFRVRVYNSRTREYVVPRSENQNILSFKGTKTKDFTARRFNSQFYIRNNYLSTFQFDVNKEDLISGNIICSVVGGIAGCHKTCDLCSGYNCNLRYREFYFKNGNLSKTLTLSPFSTSLFEIRAYNNKSGILIGNHKITGRLNARIIE